jgi:restriction endonuclease S subunit
VILRKKRGAPDLDPRFLVMFLRSPAMQQALSSLAFGATIQNIPLSELRSMLVWFATPEEQQPFIEAFMTQTALEAEIRARQAKQNDVAMQVWDSAGLIEKE